MKKTIYLICFLLLGLGAVSCQKEKITAEPVSSQEPIVFSARTPETKGLNPLNVLSELASQDFSVSAWYAAPGESFDENSKPFIVNHRFGTLASTEEAEAPTTVWQGIARDQDANKTPDPVYYPLDGTLSFFCYAPYRENGEDASIQIIHNPEEDITSNLKNYLPGSPLLRFMPEKTITKQLDFVAATPVLNWEKGNGTIPLDFTQHLTTQLQFMCDFVGTKNEEEQILISNIQVLNVINSEYLYFTKVGNQLGYQWCNDISPVNGTREMPRNIPYILSVKDNTLSQSFLSRHDDNENTYTHVNGNNNGRMYVLPQTFKAESLAGLESPPQLKITYRIMVGTESVEENTLSYDLTGTKDWLIGQGVAYYITIGVAERKILNLNAVITNWVDAGNMQGDPEELLY